MAEAYYERRSVAIAMQTYLFNKGWTDITKVFEGFANDSQITLPMVAIYLLPSRGKELEMGRSLTTNKSYTRSIQVNAYMESEPRAMSIIDDIVNFIDETTISIVAPDNSVLGTIYNPNWESITSNVLPPNMAKPKVIRWRGIVTSPMEAHYLNS